MRDVQTCDHRRVRVRYLLRLVANFGTLATPAGVLIALVGRARLATGPRGLILASGYRIPIPPAGAFTVGNVILTRHPIEYLTESPRLLAHEERHSWQYVACLGLPLIPLYLLACAWSYLRAGDYWSHNIFEIRAGLSDGGYTRRRRDRSPTS